MNPFLTPVHLSIVIPSHRSVTEVRTLLQSLMAQRLSAESFEKIEVLWVVNGGSFDVCEKLRDEIINPQWKERIQVLYQKNSHANKARNLGARQAMGRNLFFLDDDLEFPSVFSIQRLMDWISQQSAEGRWAVGGVYSLGRHSRAGKAYFRLSRRFWNAQDHNAFLLAGFMILPRPLFLEMGGFSESRAWGGSELMLNEEFRSRGVQVQRDDRLHLIHHLPLTSSDLIRKGLKQGEGARLMRNDQAGSMVEPLVRDWNTRLYLLAFHVGLRAPVVVRHVVLKMPRLLDAHLLFSLVLYRLLRRLGYQSQWGWKALWHLLYWSYGFRFKTNAMNSKLANDSFRTWAWIFVPGFIVGRKR